MYEQQLEQVENNILRINENQLMLESTSTQMETVGALHAATKASKQAMSDLNIDRVDKVLEEITETNDQLRMVQDALGAPLGPAAELDDDELLNELEVRCRLVCILVVYFFPVHHQRASETGDGGRGVGRRVDEACASANAQGAAGEAALGASSACQDKGGAGAGGVGGGNGLVMFWVFVRLSSQPPSHNSIMTLTPEELMAQPDADHDLEAWYMDESDDDQRKEHRYDIMHDVAVLHTHSGQVVLH